MRINTPVTDREVVVGAEDLIVSRTDLQGRIVFVNWTFISISGFSEEELIGKSHNIVRHPDMPPEAFADLWQTLQTGRPWSGLVKNRCKNGDFYWVKADASPIVEDGVITGYLSVRTKPSRSEIESAAALYSSLRDGSAKGIALSAGRPIGTGWLARLARLTTESSFKGRLVALVGLLSLLIAGVGFLGISGQSSTGEELRKVYQDRTVPLTQIADIRRRLLQNRLSIAVSLVTPDAETIRTNTAVIERNIDEISRLWDSFSARSMDASEKALADQFAQDRGRFVKEGLKPAIGALRKGDVTEAERIVIDKIRPLYGPVDSGIDALTKLQVELSKREYEQSHRDFIAMRNLSIASILIGVAIAIAFGVLMIRSLVNSLLRAESIAQSVARGDLSVAVGFSPRDETGSLIDALRIMMQTLKGVESAQAEMLKLHAAGQLDYKIGAQQFQGSYRKMAEQVNELASSYIFLNNHIVDVVQRYSAGDLSSDLERLPGQKARITAAIDGVKASLSAINTQIDQLVGSAARGDFTARGDAEKFQHDFRKMIQGLNRLMQTSDVGLQEVARVMRGLARGDLTERIDNQYEGTFGQLKDDANTTVEKLNGMMAQIKLAAEAMKAAASEIASGNGDLSQRTEEQATSLEETAASLEQLTAAVRQNADNSQQANQLAKEATEVAQKGGVVVGEVVQTMAMINESSRRIADIIGVIDGIAFQTNILALNAAVEAARAGEQGRGFAVVATEVRSLAQRSATAAKEIKDLIGDSVEKVDAGTRLVGNAGRTMEDVVQSIRRVSMLIGDINAASQEQSTGIEQVNAAVTQMDEVTQQNAALVEQVAASAESMEEQAKALNTSVGAFLLADDAGPRADATKRGPSLTKQRAKQAA